MILEMRPCVTKISVLILTFINPLQKSVLILLLSVVLVLKNGPTRTCSGPYVLNDIIIIDTPGYMYAAGQKVVHTNGTRVPGYRVHNVVRFR